MKKVGIVSCYFKNNYGSLLQAYATQKIVDDLGIPNETINVDENIDFKNGKRKYYLTQIYNYQFIKTKLGMIKLNIDKKINKELGENIKVRNKKFEEFREKFNITKPYRTYKDLNEVCKNYSSVIVGSDQLWLPVNIVADYYTLNFVPENINKVSYSTSFGISEVPQKYRDKYIKFLNRIEYLSTREDSGKKIIKDLTKRDIPVVCDPTLLFNKDEWMDIQEENRIIKEKYIFCYFLGNNIEHRKFAERLKLETGYKIISLNHCDEYVKYSDIFADEIPYDIGPGEFINLIRHAEYICTDSFHGSIFSMINNKEFFIFRRHSNKSKMSTNSRLDSLLKMVGLKERILTGNENVNEQIQESIDYNSVNKKLENLRNESKKFLENALSKEIKDLSL